MNMELRFNIVEDVSIILHLIKVYEIIAAIPMDGGVYRVTGQAIIDSANKVKWQ